MRADAALAAKAALETAGETLRVAEQRTADCEQNGHRLTQEKEVLEVDLAAAARERAEAIRARDEAIARAQFAEDGRGGDVEQIEARMIELSEDVRRKEQQILQLQLTVHKECQERGVLLEQLKGLQARLSKPPPPMPMPGEICRYFTH
jgi:hypothetical protein